MTYQEKLMLCNMYNVTEQNFTELYRLMGSIINNMLDDEGVITPENDGDLEYVTLQWNCVFSTASKKAVCAEIMTKYALQNGYLDRHSVLKNGHEEFFNKFFEDATLSMIHDTLDGELDCIEEEKLEYICGEHLHDIQREHHENRDEYPAYIQEFHEFTVRKRKVLKQIAFSNYLSGYAHAINLMHV